MARMMPSQVVQTIDELFSHAAKTNLATCSLVARYYKADQRLSADYADLILAERPSMSS